MKKNWQTFALIAPCLLLLAACQPNRPKAANDEESALREAGYARAPVITGVNQSDPSTFVVTGLASGDGRVRVVYQGTHAVGVTADSKGRFRAELPATAQGGIYDLSMDDNGRPMHADGRLFIPQGHPEKAVLLRSGSPSQPLLNPNTVAAVIDIGGNGGAAISGRTAPNSDVKLMEGGDLRGQTRSDAQGNYSLTTRILPPTETPETWSFTLQAGTATVNENIPVVLPNAAVGDQVTPIGSGWRVDWVLPGGGMQTSFVF